MAHTASADTDVAVLVTACLQGDQRAWARLVDHFTPLVWTITRSHRLSPADCQDVYQLTWMRAVQHLPQLRESTQVAAWLATTARRECLKHIRSSRRLVPVGDSPLFDVFESSPS
ncbi:RNA polymerase sigma factor [Streptomyces sp. NPDC055722]